MRGKWFKLLLACLMAGSLALTGCGDDGDDGRNGVDGDAGKSAYEIAVENGFEGTEAEWLASLEGGTDLVSPQAAETNQCITCHTSYNAEALAAAPFGDEVTQRFLTSRHANQNARAGSCSACHSHEGGVALLKMERFTSDADLKAAYTADTVDAYALPVGTNTIVGVNNKTCSTCHTTSHYPTSPGLRGMGDTLDAEGNVVFSAEFNLCTACHMVDVELNDDGAYVLSEAYLAENQISAETGTFDSSKRVFYHDGASGNYRTMADTHFGGTALAHFTFGENEGSAENIEITGYNINAGHRNACTVCHDPHTGGKLIAKEDGAFPDANGEAGDNPVIEIAQNVGKFHGSSWGYPFGNGNTSCMPCHNGGSISSLASGGDASSNDMIEVVTEVASCRTCHDLAQANDGPGLNNHAAFAAVREFPAGYEFTFPSGEVVMDDLGVNAVCFECHKGRYAPDHYGYNYLHYAGSFATLYGVESGMFDLYRAEEDYAGLFEHPDLGIGAFSCNTCHDVHSSNDNNVAASKMANPDYEYAPGKTCYACHSSGSLSVENRRASTDRYGERLFETVFAAVQANGYAGTRADFAEYMAGRSNDLIETTPALLKAAHTWRALIYHDGSPYSHDDVHGHGGSWAHNSLFTKQLLFDAIEDLGGDLSGLSRP